MHLLPGSCPPATCPKVSFPSYRADTCRSISLVPWHTVAMTHDRGCLMHTINLHRPVSSYSPPGPCNICVRVHTVFSTYTSPPSLCGARIHQQLCLWQGSGWFKNALFKDAPAWQSQLIMYAFRAGRGKQLRYQVSTSTLHGCTSCHAGSIQKALSNNPAIQLLAVQPGALILCRTLILCNSMHACEWARAFWTCNLLCSGCNLYCVCLVVNAILIMNAIQRYG